MSFNSYCEMQEQPSPSPAPSGSADPSCADPGNSIVHVGDVSPAVTAGDVNVQLGDIADVAAGGSPGSGIDVTPNLDVGHALGGNIGDVLGGLNAVDPISSTPIGELLKDALDAAFNGVDGDSGPPHGGLISELVKSVGDTVDHVTNLDLSDVGGILDAGHLPDLPVDIVPDCLTGTINHLDVADLGGILGHHG